VEYRGQETWVDTVGGAHGSPPRIDAAIDVHYDPRFPHRSVPDARYARGSDGESVPSGLAIPRRHPLQWIFIYMGAAFSLGMFYEGVIPAQSALLLAAVLTPMIPVVVARCLFRDQVRSRAILWYACVVAEIAATCMNVAGSEWNGRLLPFAFSLCLNAAGLAWYLGAVRSSRVLVAPSNWKGSIVRSLQEGRKFHIWLSLPRVQLEVKIIRGHFCFGVPPLRGIVRVQRSDAAGLAVRPAVTEAANAGAISAADLASSGGMWLRRVPGVRELFERFPSAVIVVRPDAIYVTVFVGLVAVADALFAAEMARDIVSGLSNAPEAIQGYRDGSQEGPRELDPVGRRPVPDMLKRWEEF
jgi:hypothetical protein